MSGHAEADAFIVVFGTPTAPPTLLRPQAIRAARELWRRGIPERRIAELLHLTAGAVRELLAARNGPAPGRRGRLERTPHHRPQEDA